MRSIGKLIGLVGSSLLSRGELAQFNETLNLAFKRYLLETKPLISQVAIFMLIAAEDHRFVRHVGVDPIAICGATWRYMRYGKKGGASTIEQQLARVLTGRYEYTFQRKIREILLATQIRKIIPKEDVPGLYLSVAYFGADMNGYSQAYKGLLRRGAITPQGMAGLIARLKYPEPRLASQVIRDKIGRRANYILRRYQQLFVDSGVSQVGEVRIDEAV